jgi:hypothetical protein
VRTEIMRSGVIARRRACSTVVRKRGEKRGES